MSVIGAIIGGAIGGGSGMFKYHSERRKRNRAFRRKQRELRDWGKDFHGEAAAENAMYMRSLRNLQQQQQVGQGTAGLAAQRNLQEAASQGLADLTIGRRAAFESGKRERERAVEAAQDARLQQGDTWDTLSEYIGDYILPGAVRGASFGMLAGGGGGNGSTTEGSLQVAQQIAAEQEAKRQQEKLAAALPEEGTQEAAPLINPWATQMQLPQQYGQQPWQTQQPYAIGGYGAPQAVQRGDTQFQTGVTQQSGQMGMQGGDSDSGYLNSLGRLRMRSTRRR